MLKERKLTFGFNTNSFIANQATLQSTRTKDHESAFLALQAGVDPDNMLFKYM